jgi:hypothetical protein
VHQIQLIAYHTMASILAVFINLFLHYLRSLLWIYSCCNYIFKSSVNIINKFLFCFSVFTSILLYLLLQGYKRNDGALILNSLLENFKIFSSYAFCNHKAFPVLESIVVWRNQRRYQWQFFPCDLELNTFAWSPFPFSSDF